MYHFHNMFVRMSSHQCTNDGPGEAHGAREFINCGLTTGPFSVRPGREDRPTVEPLGMRGPYRRTTLIAPDGIWLPGARTTHIWCNWVEDTEPTESQ
jgi:hypothetical protein